MQPEPSFTPFARAALGEYGFSAAADVETLSISENGIYLVREGDRALVLRVHRPGYQDLRSIESELVWMRHVRNASGIRTPDPIPAATGETVCVVRVNGDLRHVDAMTVIPGANAEEAGVAVPYQELGRIAAVMHTLAEEWTPPEGFTRFRWDLDSTLGANPRWGVLAGAPGVTGSSLGILTEAAGRVLARLAEYGASRRRFGLAHTDIRLSNIMVGPDGELTVIDFDDMGWSWFLTDLGAVVSWVEHHEETAQIVRTWLDGYHEVRTLEPADLEMLPTFVTLRRLMLTAWIGTHPTSPPALQFGEEFARGSVEVALRYLHDPGWMRF